MVCSATKLAVYRPRRPRASPLYRTIEHYLPEFERTYEPRFARRYGPWRPIIGDVAHRFFAVATCILASLASDAPTAITKCSSPFFASNVTSVQAAIKNEPSWLPKPLPTPFARPYLTGNWSSPFPNGCEFTIGTIAAAHRSSHRFSRAGSVSTWARLIKRVCEVDPLECPECGGAMKITSFIERRQSDVIQRILHHCGLWQGFIRTHASPRAPPAAKSPLSSVPCEFVLVPDGEFLEAQFRETQASRELQLVLDPEFL